MPDISTLIANTNNVRAFSIRALTDGDSHLETFRGREYLVVPVVCLVEGVVQGLNAETPELALAEEFGRVPEGWDGRPVVMNHPVLQGQLVSANSPAALEAFQLGMLFNSRIEDKKLKSDAWLDTVMITDMGGEALTTLERIKDGKTVEVSTGLYTGVEETSGRYNSKDYGAIWRGVIPDHLAFLSEGSIGACSIEDGCGTPRVNVGNLKVHQSALVWQECGCIHTHIPVVNANGGTPMPEPTPTPTPNVRFHAAIAIAVGESPSFDVVRLMDNSYPDTMLDSDIRNLVNEALRSSTNEWAYIIGFTKTMVVYESYDAGKGQYLCFQRTFDIGADNKVTLGANIQQVHITMSVSPVTANQGNGTEGTMPTTLAQPHGNSGEPDMPDNTPAPAADPVVTTPASVANAAPTPVATPVAAPVVQAAPRTLEQYIAEAPLAIQAVLNSGLKMLEERKEALIKGLKSTNRCKFTDQQLAAMNISVLEQLTELANIPVFNGLNPGPREIVDNEGFAPEPPSLIPAANA